MENRITWPVTAKDAFRRALCHSLAAYEFRRLKLIPSADHDLFQRRIDRLLYVPKLPSAGDAERQIIKRLEKLATEKDWEGRGRALRMAKAFRDLLPLDPRNPGGYYIRRALTPKANKAEYDWVNALIDSARTSKQWEKVWFGEQILLGLPKSVSNFRVECLFLLRNAEGVVARLVRLKNTEGETSHGPNPGGCEILDAHAFASAERFSEWALAYGNFVWEPGITELRMLQADMAKESAWRVVRQVDSCGWFPLDGPQEDGLQSGIWFFNDCAYADGSQVPIDAQGIYWYRGEGYYLTRKGRESNFLQGRPSMHPKAAIRDVLSPLNWKNLPEDQTEDATLRAFFREVCQRLTDTLGGTQALLAIGSILAYAAAPEIFHKYGFFPGLFVHGQKGSGKSKLTSWLLAFWSFAMHSGISLTEKTSTAVGMLQELENYSNLPVWFDEYRDHQIDPGKVSVLRNCYDRSAQAKWSQDGKQREIRTAPIVSGESTSSDAATRSRYPHVQVSAHLRRENHLSWFTANRSSFFLFARLLMEQRAEFVNALFTFLNHWTELPALAGMDEREKMVHGIPYASWMAIAKLLQSHDVEEITAFKNFMLTHSKSAASDVASETNLNGFFSDLITATVNGAIPLTCYRLEAELLDHPADAPDKDADGNYIQGRWNAYTLYIDPPTTLSCLQIFLRKQGASIVLKKKDLRDQMAVEPYWVRGDYTKHFRGKNTIRPWGIRVDLHPMGTRVVSNEEYLRFKADHGKGDPRKGELFGIVDKILEAQSKEETANSPAASRITHPD